MATCRRACDVCGHNPAPLRRHLDPRAIWVASDGQVRSGAQLIDLVSRDARRATARLEYARVRFFSNVAIVTWRETWTAPDATVKAGELTGVDAWVKTDQRWRLVSTAEVRPPH
ncbi:nuclear transport factor 2 family protein [Sphingomonas sp. RS2018]